MLTGQVMPSHAGTPSLASRQQPRHNKQLLLPATAPPAQCWALARCAMQQAAPCVQLEGPVKRVQRRVVLTGSALLERRTSTFEVVRHQALSSLAAVVRFWEEPQWLAFEWTTGSPATLYVLPGRDALLTATLHAAQVGCCPAPECLGCRWGLRALVWCPAREPGASGAFCWHVASSGGLAERVLEWLGLLGDLGVHVQRCPGVAVCNWSRGRPVHRCL